MLISTEIYNQQCLLCNDLHLEGHYIEMTLKLEYSSQKHFTYISTYCQFCNDLYKSLEPLNDLQWFIIGLCRISGAPDIRRRILAYHTKCLTLKKDFCSKLQPSGFNFTLLFLKLQYYRKICFHLVFNHPFNTFMSYDTKN